MSEKTLNLARQVYRNLDPAAIGELAAVYEDAMIDGCGDDETVDRLTATLPRFVDCFSDELLEYVAREAFDAFEAARGSERVEGFADDLRDGDVCPN